MTVPDWSISCGWLLAPLLVAVIVYDLRFMRIPNKLVYLFLILAMAALPFSLPIEELLWRLLAAVLVFAATLTLFALRILGGGDVKILAALTLFVPSSDWSGVALILALSLFAGIGVLIALRRLTGDLLATWRGVQDRARFPMGFSIGMAGLIYLTVGPILLGSA